MEIARLVDNGTPLLMLSPQRKDFRGGLQSDHTTNENAEPPSIMSSSKFHPLYGPKSYLDIDSVLICKDLDF